uniref:SAM domain-containing protein n=1 Tax=Alexandrium catenella TaxID=2925 RepID=A0A7S1SAM3_ALECA|mmetsp:Transcript_92449/g.245543  ORF Transcript_92449/g.245543 Transcript_92449/m.245543 type:complete len:587 (+) Transcript_92449:76-1836(+)
MPAHYRLSNGSVQRLGRYSICEKYDSDWKGLGDSEEIDEKDLTLDADGHCASEAESEECDCGLDGRALEGLETAPPQLVDWGPEHVASWALSLGLPPETASQLQQNGVGGDKLQCLTAVDFMSMGIDKMGQLRRLLESRQELADRSPHDRENLPPHPFGDNLDLNFEALKDPSEAGPPLHQQLDLTGYPCDVPTPLTLTSRTRLASPRTPRNTIPRPEEYDDCIATRLDTAVVVPDIGDDSFEGLQEEEPQATRTLAASVPVPAPGVPFPVTTAIATPASTCAAPRVAVASPQRGVVIGALPGHRVSNSTTVTGSPTCKTARVVITTQCYSPQKTGHIHFEAHSPPSTTHRVERAAASPPACGSRSPGCKETVVVSRSPTAAVSTPGGSRSNTAQYVAACTPGRAAAAGGGSLVVSAPSGSQSPRTAARGTSVVIQPAAPRAPPLSWSPPAPGPAPAPGQRAARSPTTQSWAPPVMASPHRVRGGRGTRGAAQDTGLDRISEQSPPPMARAASPFSRVVKSPWAHRSPSTPGRAAMVRSPVLSPTPPAANGTQPAASGSGHSVTVSGSGLPDGRIQWQAGLPRCSV